MLVPIPPLNVFLKFAAKQDLTVSQLGAKSDLKTKNAHKEKKYIEIK